MRPRFWLKGPVGIALLSALVTLTVACGSGDSKTETKATSAPQSTSAAPAAAATQAAPKGDDPNELVMAFVPSRDVATIQTNADKIAAYMAKDLGKSVKSVTLTSYAAVAVALGNKRADIAWMGPLDYLITREQTGASPITCSVRNGLRGYKSFIVVRNDSGINTLADLKGKTFAFGDPVSTSSSLVPKGALKAAGVDPTKDLKSVNISNQGAIAAAVYEGKADAGAFFDDARTNVRNQYPDIMDKTKIIYTSELIPCDPQVVRKGLDDALVAKIQATMLKMSADPEAKVWLKDLFTIDELSKATDADYDGLRRTVQSIQPDLLKGYPSPTPSATP